MLVLDFDGVLTDNRVWVNERGEESVACWRSDGLGISAVQRLGIYVCIISTETNPVVSARASKLKLPVTQSCENKLEQLNAIAEAENLPLASVAYVGNDVNDLDCLKAVGLPIVVRDAHKAVWDSAVYRTEACGGRGAVREVCDLIVAEQNQ
jgi:3-deoxy-D-manno-octulosonate 8-phosphate phosphatase (KDO 8-P phosphatase)